MVPDKFDMVDMGGIDLIESQGVAVKGLYRKLVVSLTLCRYQCLYNWKFNGILIPPTNVEMELRDGSVWINEGVNVDENDVVHIYSLGPNLTQVFINSNGDYTPPAGYDGFNFVAVSVPEAVLNNIYITENGDYTPEQGVDGFSSVTVNVSSQEGENLYCRVAVVAGSDVLFEEYYKQGDPVSISTYIIHNNIFYSFNYSANSIQDSVEMPVETLPALSTNYEIVQLLNVTELTISGLDLVLTIEPNNSIGGIVFSGDVDAIIRYSGFRYRQCGRCNSTATLPTIQSTGAGRTYWTSPQDNADATVAYVSNNNFFASGQAQDINQLIIKNFIVE